MGGRFVKNNIVKKKTKKDQRNKNSFCGRHATSNPLTGGGGGGGGGGGVEKDTHYR